MTTHDNLPALRQAARKHRSADVYDIVLFGSAVRGSTPRDYDVAIILRRPLAPAQRLARGQSFRATVPSLPVQVQAITIDDLEDAGFLARQGIISEGVSLLTKKPLAARFGFEARTLIQFSLRDKTPSERRTINYALARRRNAPGFLELHDGEQLAPGLLTVPIAQTARIEELLLHYKIPYQRTTIIRPRF